MNVSRETFQIQKNCNNSICEYKIIYNYNVIKFLKSNVSRETLNKNNYICFT